MLSIRARRSRSLWDRVPLEDRGEMSHVCTQSRQCPNRTPEDRGFHEHFSGSHASEKSLQKPPPRWDEQMFLFVDEPIAALSHNIWVRTVVGAGQTFLVCSCPQRNQFCKQCRGTSMHLMQSMCRVRAENDMQLGYIWCCCFFRKTGRSATSAATARNCKTNCKQLENQLQATAAGAG